MSSNNIGLSNVEGEQNKEYVLSSGGFTASARLNLQHFFFEMQTGYQLSPLISTNGQNLRIADLGSGTGIWPVELSSKLPASTTFDAFDITKNLFPREEWRPSNVTFRHLDIFDPVPESLVGKYDIVHIRFLTPVVGRTGPAPAIKTALQLLKPGGMLQWAERVVSLEGATEGPNNTEAMQALKDTMRDIVMKMMHDLRYRIWNFASIGSTQLTLPSWVTTLDKVFESSGFVDVKNELYPLPRTMIGSGMDLGFQTVEEASFGLDRMMGEDVGDRVRIKLTAAYEEHRLHGSSMDGDLVVCVGRKAA